MSEGHGALPRKYAVLSQTDPTQRTALGVHWVHVKKEQHDFFTTPRSMNEWARCCHFSAVSQALPDKVYAHTFTWFQVLREVLPLALTPKNMSFLMDHDLVTSWSTDDLKEYDQNVPLITGIKLA